MMRDAHRSAGCVARLSAALFAAMITTVSGPAAADQGGVGFWLPGSFGSLAATPLVPGWSVAAIYLHSSVSAGGGVAASRSIGLRDRAVNLTVNLDARLKARADLGVLAPTYVFATPVFGGQFAINVLAIYGRQQANIDATITGALGPIGFGTERSISHPSTHGAMCLCSRRSAGIRECTTTWCTA